MGISESKKKIVIDNYFKEECDVNTSIKEAFTKGFELGLKKAPQPKTGHWIDKTKNSAVCSCCNKNNTLYGDFCKWCGAKMIEPQESEDNE